jgi:hypothetical protein
MTDPTTRLLAVGPHDGPWPPRLAAEIDNGSIVVERVSTLYDAAARLSHAAHAYHALLLDAARLSRRDLQLLPTFTRHKALPMWLLPATTGAHVRFHEATGLGAVPLEEALQATRSSPQEVPTQHGPKGNNEKCKLLHTSAPPDKRGPDDARDHAEIPVTTQVAARYDEAGAQPVLSDDELRALLGAMD